MGSESKRIYIGGLPPEVTTEEITQRFSKFGQVSSINIRTKKNDDGEVTRTFAHVSLNLKDSDWKKCLKTYNKTKWKGHEMSIQEAKESFLSRLEKERAASKDEAEVKDKTSQEKKKKTELKYEMKGAKPGTEVEGQKDWIVGKFGHVLPVVNIRRKDKKKIIKIDPSKLVHNVKKLDKNADDDDVEDAGILTWKMDDSDDDITKKRKGIFPEYSPPKKKKKAQPDVTVEESSSDETEDNEVEFDIVPISYTSIKANDMDKMEESCDSADTDEILATQKTKLNAGIHNTKCKDEKTVKSSKRKQAKMDTSSSDGSESSSDEEKICVKNKTKKIKFKPSKKVDIRISDSSSDSSSEAISHHKNNNMSVKEKNNKNLSTQNEIKTLSSDSSDSSSSDEINIKSSESRNRSEEKLAVSSSYESSATSCDTSSSKSMQRKTRSRLQIRKKDKPPQTSDKGRSPAQRDSSSSDSSHNSSSEDTDDVIKREKERAKTKEDLLKREKEKAKDDLIKGKEKIKTKCDLIKREKEKVTTETQPAQKSATDILDKMMTNTMKGQKDKKKKKKLNVDDKTEKKHKLDNEKRLESLKQKQQAARSKANLIKVALASVDSAGNKKKIVFDSDSEDDKMVETVEKKVTNSSKPDKTKQNKQRHAESDLKPNPVLFEYDSGTEGDDESEAEDKETFRIRPEYEGKAGRKLMTLQGRFGNDDRFKMDKKFLDSDSEDDSMEEAPEAEEQKSDGISQAERDRTLAILASVVRPTVPDKKQKKHFKDVSTLHYDPTREDHSHFEVRQETPTKKKKEDKKSKKRKVEEAVVELPEVSQEKFYEVPSSLRDMFGGQQEGFSLLSQFGQPEKNDRSQDDAASAMPKMDLSEGWKKRDSTDEDEPALDQNSNKEEHINKSDISMQEGTPMTSSTFFFGANDSRIAEGIAAFHCKEDADTVRQKWSELRPKIIELYKLRRKRALRSKKASNEIRLGKMGQAGGKFNNHKKRKY